MSGASPGISSASASASTDGEGMKRTVPPCDCGGRSSRPVAATPRQHPADSLRHFGIALRFGRAGWEPRCEDYLPAGVEERLDLCESFGADYLRRRHDQRAQRLGLMLAFQQKAPLRDARPLAREHFGVQIDEVAPEPVGQPATYLHVIHVRHADSAFVGGQRAVEPVGRPASSRSDRVRRCPSPAARRFAAGRSAGRETC